MKQTLLLLLCIGALHFTLHAQFDEVGAFFGISHYSGDLTERYLEPLEFNKAGGLYVRKKMSDRFGWRFQLMKGKLSGNDANSSVESNLWKRNLNFHSNIFEIAALAEYHIFKIKKEKYGVSPYFFAGLAGLYFTPYTEYEGTTYDLHHYRTEGVDYNPFQIVVPFGGGMKLQINEKIFFGAEVGIRKTFTDYLDDVSGTYPSNLALESDFGSSNVRTALAYRVPEINDAAPALPPAGSQRGNPDKKDWYMFFGLMMGMRLK